MITGLIEFVMGGALQLVLLLLALLPAVDLSALPLAMPQGVADVLGALNWFVPVGDLITILTAWVGLVLAVNVAMVVQRVVSSVKGG